jgi:beta-glucosidase
VKSKSTTPFLWGAATSSHQIEGDCIHNDWWQWEQDGHCEGGARSGKATDHLRLFREDLKLAAALGLNSYRFSVEWSRIEPEEGKWNDQAIEWYKKLIDECERNGLMPMLTLHHFTSPLWFAKQGGFTNPDCVQKFCLYVEKVIDALGAHVPLWCTFNEPMVLVAGTYLGKFMPPAIFSPVKASLACRHLLKCHVLAYDLIHERVKNRQGPWKDHPLYVGIAHNMLDFKPDRKWHPAELVLTHIFHRFYNRAWLDAVTGRRQHFGVLGLMPYAKQVTEARNRKTVDYIGVNYYTKAYVQWWPRAPAQERPAALPLGIEFARRHNPVSDLGWAIHPNGFAKILKYAACYGLPIYVTENGIADREDKLRAQFLDLHLNELQKCREQGLDIRGYYYWSLLDNFEWIKGFGPRFGLYRVDYDSFERSSTSSVATLKSWTQKF